jgi:hypothetical protein
VVVLIAVGNQPSVESVGKNKLVSVDVVVLVRGLKSGLPRVSDADDAAA